MIRAQAEEYTEEKKKNPLQPYLEQYGGESGDRLLYLVGGERERERVWKLSPGLLKSPAEGVEGWLTGFRLPSLGQSSLASTPRQPSHTTTTPTLS